MPLNACVKTHVYNIVCIHMLKVRLLHTQMITNMLT